MAFSSLTRVSHAWHSAEACKPFDAGMSCPDLGLVPRNVCVETCNGRCDAVEILHIDLQGATSSPPPGLPGARVLLIFWRGNRPIGQRYGNRDHLGALSVISPPENLVPTDLADGVGKVAERSLSVVICTRDRPDALRRCLRSLVNQTRRPTQVLVVDNASRDAIARSIALAFGADYVREDCAGLDYARNRGVRESTGDIVAFIDDDVIVHPAWAEHVMAAFDTAAIMAVTGLVLPAELETHAQIIFERNWGFGRGYERVDFTPAFLTKSGRHVAPTWEIGAGANMAFRREVFAKAGYFDERLDAGAAGCGGDSEYWYRILARGWWCRYEPSVVAFHFHRRGKEALARQIKAYMRGHVATLLVQHRRYHDRRNLRRIFVTLPKWYAAMLLSRLRSGKNGRNDFVWQEVVGAIEGVIYSLLRRRSREAFEPVPRISFLERILYGANGPGAVAGKRSGEIGAGPVQDGDLVSVVVPAFNAAGTIAETLRSVCEQTYRNLEIIVVDDGSNDLTSEIVRTLANDDPRIRLIRQGNKGVAAARNLGVSHSRGEFIAPLDADDLWRPIKIEKQMEALRKIGPDCGLVYTWYAQIDIAGRVVSRKHRPVEEGDVLTRMCRGNVVGNGSGALMRKNAMLEAGLYDENLRAREAQGCEDLKLYFRIAERHLFAVVKQHLTGYRRVPWNMSGDVLQMERSNRFVTADFLSRYPEHAGLFRIGRAFFLKWLFVRAIRARKLREAFILARKLFATNRGFAAKTIGLLPATLLRGWLVPRLKWIAKRLLCRDADPIYFLKPAKVLTDAAAASRRLQVADTRRSSGARRPGGGVGLLREKGAGKCGSPSEG